MSISVERGLGKSGEEGFVDRFSAAAGQLAFLHAQLPGRSGAQLISDFHDIVVHN